MRSARDPDAVEARSAIAMVARDVDFDDTVPDASSKPAAVVGIVRRLVSDRPRTKSTGTSATIDNLADQLVVVVGTRSNGHRGCTNLIRIKSSRHDSAHSE